jgi:DNA-binding GntR family transcriptional regulator
MLGLDRTKLGDAVREHVPLLDAVRRGDGARASELMRAHVERFEDEMRDALLGT